MLLFVVANVASVDLRSFGAKEGERMIACVDVSENDVTSLALSPAYDDDDESLLETRQVSSTATTTTTTTTAKRFVMRICPDDMPLTEGDVVLHREAMEQIRSLRGGGGESSGHLNETIVVERYPRYCATIASARQCTLSPMVELSSKQYERCLDVFLHNVAVWWSPGGDVFADLELAGNDCLVRVMRMRTSGRVLVCRPVSMPRHDDDECSLVPIGILSSPASSPVLFSLSFLLFVFLAPS